jgi:nucleoside-diphosphate-sugar epimerase
MRVFVTGASGHIGSAVVPELLSGGHTVVGLARSDASAAALEAAGAEVRRGDLSDPDGVAAAAAEADGVIHLAFQHESMRTGNWLEAVALDQTVVEKIGDALAGSGKPFVGTGGTMLLAGEGRAERPGTEEDVVPAGPRVDAENYVIGLAERDVRSSVIRLTPTVHSDLDRTGFVPTLVAIARQAGISGYPGDGQNRWPAVHTLDAARVYRLALETAPAGSRLHAAAESGVPFADIAAAIGRGVGVPAQSIDPDQVESHFSFLARFVGTDNPVSSEITQRVLAWTPSEPELIADIDAGHYFRED